MEELLQTITGGAGIDTADFSDIDVPVTATLDADGNGTATREIGFGVNFEGVAVESLNTGAIANDVAFLTEALAGNLYFNVHTNDFNGGEIRGQLDNIVSNDLVNGVGTVVISGTLDAAQEPGPTSDSAATGTGTITLVVGADGEITYDLDLDISGLATSDLLPVAGFSAIHLHNAPAGINGPVVLDVIQDAGGDITGATADPDADTGDGNVFAEVVEINTLTSIENITGSDDADVITGDNQDNVLIGNADDDSLVGAGGNDILDGGAGNDILNGGGGTDIINGGEGIDTNDFSTINAAAADPAIAGVTVALNADGTGTAEYIAGGIAGNPVIFEEFTGIENITGTNNNDTIIASGAAANVIDGGAGDDVIAGGGGTDILNGGEGIDTNSFQGIGAEVVADLASGAASYQPNPTTTVFENFQGFENLLGSDNDDQLFGDGNNNVLSGADGNDLLAGRGGNDILNGGLGNDVLRGGGGADSLDGGDGIDTADFSDINASVTANLAAGTANYAAPNGNNVQDTVVNIENIVGSENDDTLTGDANDNEINGGAGADILNGGAGDDILRGDAIGDGEAVVVTVTNTLPDGGTFLTPVWFGFHDGANFDLFNAGDAASLGLERLAEDGSVEGIAAEFNQQVGDNGVDATIIGGVGVPGPIDPGESASFTLNVNPNQVGQGFFTWATMVIPSNDAFLAVPDNALADPIFDANGNFTPLTIRRFGSDVLDAGTEVNNELDAAFLNQTAPNTGTDENGVVGQHPGFNGSVGNPNATPANILGGNTPGGIIDPTIGDFTANPNQQLLQIDITRLVGGSDILDGGLGDDVLDGGSGSDTLTGGEGEDVFAFSGDPFDGLDVSAPGRQVSGDEDFITDFDFDNDRYRFDVANFGLFDSTVNFLSLDANAVGSTISDDANVIVLQNANNDDPNTPFSAVAAAEQIASLTDESRAGFFVYFNTNLGVNRLVYSADLSDANADLSIVSRQTDLTDDDAIAALANFTADNFEFDDNNLLDQESTLLLPGNNLLQLDLDVDANALQFTINTVNVTQVSELQLFRTDALGTVIGDGPVQSFSLLAPDDQLADFSPQFTVDEFLDDEFLRAELVGFDGTRTISSLTAINASQVALDFGDNTVVNVEIGQFDVGIGTSALEVNAVGDEVIDLTGENGVLTATFSIFREAAFDNIIGFYDTVDANGGVIDSVTGITLLPGDTGYREAALANQIDVTLSGENGQEVTATATLEAGGFLGTFLVADGDFNGDIFFSFGAANGGDDHVRQLGDNTIGFEDLAGLGDADFNDVIVEFSLV